jgi:Mor family transcriptional regulator
MKSKKISERNKKIKEEFNGKNLFFLSKKYNICVRQVRRILKS